MPTFNSPTYEQKIIKIAEEKVKRLNLLKDGYVHAQVSMDRAPYYIVWFKDINNNLITSIGFEHKILKCNTVW